MRHIASLGVALATVLVSGMGIAQGVPADTAVVALFDRTCVAGGLSIATRESAIAGDAGWQVADPATIRVAEFATVPTLDRNFDFAKPVTVRHWTRNQNGQTVHAVLATFDGKRRYPSLCAVIVPDIRSMMPYYDAFKQVATSIGLRTKSNNLPHYLELSGKPQPDHPVRADMFSRTRAVADKNSMHMYVAF